MPDDLEELDAEVREVLGLPDDLEMLETRMRERLARAREDGGMRKALTSALGDRYGVCCGEPRQHVRDYQGDAWNVCVTCGDGEPARPQMSPVEIVAEGGRSRPMQWAIIPPEDP